MASLPYSVAVWLVVAQSVVPSAAFGPASVPRHVVFFMIDDYGFADASYKSGMYNGTAPPPTPTIDALAMSGVRLESHYVNKLCSPTRTAFLSGRYAYTIGMDDGVIIDGQNIDLPLNLNTIADRLSKGGWKTSAYGKWDAGMTTWGSTPTCRGFDNYNGFYSAASDYFTHDVGPGYDYHRDALVDDTASGVYTTHKVTSDVQAWIRRQVKEHALITGDAHRPEAGAGAQAQAKAQAKAVLTTFAYVAHEAVHGPLEVPQRYIDGPCDRLVPDDHRTRKIYCGMVRAMDESVKNITDTYKELGIFDTTLFILSGDNGGIPQDGGSNFPLRGNKATVFEGGVRSIAFASGAGIEAAMRGTVSHELMHVTDWYATIVHGIAQLDLSDNTTGRPCPTCTRPVAPLDGVDQWPMLSTKGAPSARTEVLLDLQATALNRAADGLAIAGSGAIRVGQWKLLHGHQGVWPGQCTLRQPKTKVAPTIPIPIPLNETNPWCPYGWTPPPRNDGRYEQPIPPPEATAWPGCTAGVLPCQTPPSSGYLVGQTMLFNVVDDMFEHHNVADENPEVVADLLARLQAYNNTHCAGQRCEPDNAGGKPGTPSTTDGPGGKAVWYPWRGNTSPTACDTNRTSPPDPAAGIRSSCKPSFATLKPAPVLRIAGWCYDGAWAGKGLAAMTLRVSVDGAVVVPFTLANLTRPATFPSKSGAPNRDHGFQFALPALAAATLAGKGVHRLDVDLYTEPGPGSVHATTAPANGSPWCYRGGATARCKGGQGARARAGEAETIDEWVFRN